MTLLSRRTGRRIDRASGTDKPSSSMSPMIATMADAHLAVVALSANSACSDSSSAATFSFKAPS